MVGKPSFQLAVVPGFSKGCVGDAQHKATLFVRFRLEQQHSNKGNTQSVIAGKLNSQWSGLL
jgi:hypothetical protein